MEAASICRLCTNHSDHPYNIFVQNGSDGNVIANLISDLLQLKVSEYDVYPKNICFACIQKLDEFKNFKDECIKSKCRFDEDILISKNRIDFSEEELVAVQPKVKLEESDVIEDLELVTVEPKLEPEESDEREYIEFTNIKSESGAEYEEEVAVNNFQNDIDISEDRLKCEDECVNMVFLTSKTMISNEDVEDLQNNNSLFQEQRALFEEKFLVEDPLKLEGTDEEYVPYNLKKVISSMSKSGPCNEEIKPYNKRSRNTVSAIEKSTPCNTSRGKYEKRKSSSVKSKKPSNPHADMMDKFRRIETELGDDISSSNVQENVRRRNRREATKKSKFSKKTVIIHSNKNGNGSNQGEDSSNLIPNLKNVKVKPKSRTLVCDTCGFKATAISNLVRHIRIHTGERPYHCNMCPKKFNRQYSLNIHIKLHLGDRKFSCDICSRKFIKQSDLTYHKKVHNKEFSLFCEDCGKGFLKSSQLERHKVEHTGIKPFHCDQCNLSFTRKHGLKMHMDIHSGNKQLFHCDKCGKSYSRLRYIKRHACRI